MELEAARCPSCGAAIRVSLEADETACQYCGTTISPREAVDRAIDPALAGMARNLVVRGKLSLEAQDFPAAYRFFTQALDHEPTNAAAWQGCLLAVSRGLTKIDYGWAPFEGAAGIPAIARNYLRCTPRSRAADARSLLDRLAALLRADLALQRSLRGKARRRAGLCFLLAVALGLAALLTLLALALPFTLAFGVAAAALGIRGGVLLSRADRAAALVSPYPDDRLAGFLAGLEASMPPA